MTAVFHARAKELFLEACDLPPEERVAFLDGSCAGDPALRQAVLELLEGDARPNAILDEVEQGSGATVLAYGLALEAGFGAATPGVQLPERIGRYRIVALLGEGGMGTVYEAEQDAPRRRVALKVLRGGLGSTGQLRRFEHEAELLGRLQHPGIAHIYDAGIESSAGFPRPYYAMELVRGRALVEHARAAGLPVRARLELFARVCDAVQHAHQNGILHRDLKPGNILVDGAGDPKVLDFGVALALSDQEQADARRTAAGTLVGTLAYMSPEQLDPGARHLDTRSDIYSLGVVGYELLAGRLPYGELPAALPQAARVISEKEPVPLSRIDPALRGDLETIFGMALAKDRERRYSSAAELAADVRRHLRFEPVVARPASALYQLRKFARRNRTLVGGVALSAVVLVAATIVSGILARREAREHQRADQAASAAEQSAYRANTLAAGLALSTDNPRYARALLGTLQPAPGAWEFHRLQRLTEQWLATVQCGVSHVWWVAFGPSDAAAVLLRSDGAVESWDLASGEHHTRLPPDPGRAAPRALSADGSSALCARDGKVFLFDTTTGAERELPSPSAAPLSIWAGSWGTFSPDLRRAAFAPSKAAVLLYDLSSGARPLELSARDEPAGFLAFSGDGAVLASTHASGPIAWDGRSGALLRRFEAIPGVRSLAVDEDGSRLAVGDASSVHILELASGRESRLLTGHSDEVISLAFEPHGRRLAAVQEDGSTWIWDSDTGELLHKYWVGRASWKSSVAWSRDGSRILTGSHQGALARLWDANESLDPEVLRGHRSYVYPVRYTPDGTRIVSAGWDKTVRLWSAASGELLAVLRGHRAWISDLAVSPDGARIASVARDGDLIVWDAWTGARLAELHSKPNWKSLAWSPDGSWIAAGVDGSTGRVDLIDAGGLQSSGMLEGGSGAVSSLAFSPDSARLAVATYHYGVRLIDLRTRSLLAERTGLPHVHSVRWSPDGAELAITADGGNLLLAEGLHLQDVRALNAHPREVFSAAFSHDGSRLFSAGRDGLLLVWDVASGDLVGQFPGHKDYIWSLDPSPDGTRVATGSGDFTVRQWESQSVRETVARRESVAKLESAARPLVQRWLAELGQPDRVLQRIRADTSLEPALRASAQIELLRQCGASTLAGTSDR